MQQGAKAKAPQPHNFSPKRWVFFGTPREAVLVLDALERAGFLPALVVTQPDRPKGRGMKLAASPVKEWARERRIAVLQPASLKDPAQEERAALSRTSWEFFVVAAYGLIIPQWLLDIPRAGALNVHPSLLPRYRGPSPIQSQLRADDRACGVSIIAMDAQMDHGPIVAQKSVPPPAWPLPAPRLGEILWREGGALLAATLPRWLSGDIAPLPQDHARATYTRKLKKEDGLIDLAGDPYQNYLKYCALQPWPGVYFLHRPPHGAPQRIKITDAHFAHDAFIPRIVVPEGKKPLPYEIWRTAHPQGNVSPQGA